MWKTYSSMPSNGCRWQEENWPIGNQIQQRILQCTSLAQNENDRNGVYQTVDDMIELSANLNLDVH